MQTTKLNPKRPVGTCFIIDIDRNNEERVVINYNTYFVKDAASLVDAFDGAASFELAWWKAKYNMWMMLRPEGGDWQICAIRPWDQKMPSGKISEITFCISDAGYNTVIYNLTIPLPKYCAERLAADIEETDEHSTFLPPAGKQYDWVREYYAHEHIKAKEIWENCAMVYRLDLDEEN